MAAGPRHDGAASRTREISAAGHRGTAIGLLLIWYLTLGMNQVAYVKDKGEWI
jgi:hypothetical protein